MPAVDAGPRTYESAEDYPTEGCLAGSLDGLMVLGKWHNLPGDGSQEFDSYFLNDMGAFKGILDSIPANGILFDEDNLFLHRQFNLTSMGVNLCAVEPDGRLRGHMARCNGQDCTISTVIAELVEPVTQ